MMISLREAADRLGVSYDYTVKTARKGVFPGARRLTPRGKYLVNKNELEAWANGRTPVASA